MTFKDLFSERPDQYARYRPTYPAAVFEWLAAQAPSTKLAVDVGTGNGQAAVALAEHFDRVLGLDPSEAQLANARAHPRVEYRGRAAEQLAADDARADALFVAQALHWFEHDAFFREVRRVLVPGGVLAVSCYELSEITPEIDAVVMELYGGHLDAYWEPERKLVETGYRTIEFPFPRARRAGIRHARDVDDRRSDRLPRHMVAAQAVPERTRLRSARSDRPEAARGVGRRGGARGGLAVHGARVSLSAKRAGDSRR